MPLYRVTFTEDQGYRVACRIRAATLADHRWLAIQKIWGDAASWAPAATPGQGRVVHPATAAADAPLIPLTGLMTVTVERATRRSGVRRAHV